MHERKSSHCSVGMRPAALLYIVAIGVVFVATRTSSGTYDSQSIESINRRWLDTDRRVSMASTSHYLDLYLYASSTPTSIDNMAPQLQSHTLLFFLVFVFSIVK